MEVNQTDRLMAITKKLSCIIELSLRSISSQPKQNATRINEILLLFNNLRTIVLKQDIRLRMRISSRFDKLEDLDEMMIFKLNFSY